MKLPSPFLRLPWSFDANRLAQELDQFDEGDWMPHPSGMQGNSAVPLISREGGDNNDFDGCMKVTRHLQRCDYIQQALDRVGEVYGRSRLMRLGPGNEVSRHVDFNYHWYSRVRIHVPIVTSEQVIFHCGDEAIHMRAGECWIFDSWRHHRVVNGGQENRTHLVFDTAGSGRFWSLVRTLLGENGQAAFDARHQQVPYQDGKAVSVRTERFNSAPVMAPGEMEALALDLIRDLEGNSENDTALLNDYRNLLVDLAKDWRETWHQHGYRRTGWPIYKGLLDAVVARLNPDPRALTTASNNIGANPVIMQRILRSALKLDQIPAFLAQEKE